ncbi:MAG: rhomboid family intramembrane serine protease, partial [Acidobacteriota bacterium]
MDSERRSTLCPNCRRLISIDEPQCPYCGISHPGSRWKNNPWTRAIHDPDKFFQVIIYVNAAMFILSILLRPTGMGLALNPFSFLSPDNRILLLLGATGTIPIGEYGWWWTLVSANYLHGGI